MVAIALISFFSSILLVIFSMATEHTKFSMDPAVGVFGYLHEQWLFLHIVFCSVTCIAVTFLYSFVQHAFNSAVLDIASSLECIAAILVCRELNEQDIPGWDVWAGIVILIVGYALIAFGKLAAESDDLYLSVSNTPEEPLILNRESGGAEQLALPKFGK